MNIPKLENPIFFDIGDNSHILLKLIPQFEKQIAHVGEVINFKIQLTSFTSIKLLFNSLMVFF
jgi:uncharacterized protein YkvS